MADKARQRRSGAKPARDVQFSIRLTEDEYDEIKRAADALVFDVSAYARSVLLRTIRKVINPGLKAGALQKP